MDIIDIETTEKRQDKGFTLVELLIVIVILGILATVTVFAVRGITDKGQTSACNTDKATLQTAVESYFAQYGNTTGIPTATYAADTGFVGNPALATAVALPAGVAWAQGATPGQTLVNAGFLRALPTNYFVQTGGGLLVAKATCGTLGAAAG